MEKFKENPRQGVIVYLYRLRQSRQLRKFGHIQYISKRMKYVIIYMDQDKVEDTVERLNKLRFVKKVELSNRPFLKVDYGDSNEQEHYKLTEEDQEKFKKIKSEVK
ncbi:YlbG family protein [Ligilactobacillus sp. LYQ135]